MTLWSTGVSWGQTTSDPASTAAQVVEATADDILASVRESGAAATVVNFWATWCAPCVEEFPDFVRFAAEYRASGVRVVFVSVDFPEDRAEVEALLAEMEWHEKTFLKTGSDHEFVEAFSSPWTGAVPATMVYDDSAELRQFFSGHTGFDKLAAAVDATLR